MIIGFDEDKKAIEKAVEEAKKHQKSDDKDELEKAVKDLNDVIMPIGTKLYQAAAEDDAKTEESDEKAKDEPVEGEVVDK